MQANSIDSDNINLIEVRHRLVLLLLIRQSLLQLYPLQVIVHLAKVVLNSDLVHRLCGKALLKRGL